MKIVTNEKVVRRNARIAQISMITGLLVLGAGMYVSFARPDQFGLSLAALLAGFTLSQVGIYYSNRWGRRPRPDELINQSLKGLDSKYSLYHYQKPVSHLLVGPAGVWVLMPRHQRGTISYEKNRWRQRGGNLYLKIFAQEGLGRPDLEVPNEIEQVQKYLAERLPEGVETPPVQAALVFTHPQATVAIENGDNPPAETVTVGKLKDLIRKKAKEDSLSQPKVKQIEQVLDQSSPAE